MARKDACEETSPLTPEMVTIKEKIDLIKQKGFGEVRIQIRNGVIYRILATEESLLQVK